VAESAVQLDCLFVVNMIEKDGLIDRYPREDREDGKEDTFGLNLKSMIGNNGKKKNQDNGYEKTQKSPHINNLYEMGLLPVK
jgi:hypothetical protein